MTDQATPNDSNRKKPIKEADEQQAWPKRELGIDHGMIQIANDFDESNSEITKLFEDP